MGEWGLIWIVPMGIRVEEYGSTILQFTESRVLHKSTRLEEVFGTANIVLFDMASLFLIPRGLVFVFLRHFRLHQFSEGS